MLVLLSELFLGDYQGYPTSMLDYLEKLIQFRISTVTEYQSSCIYLVLVSISLRSLTSISPKAR